MKKILITGGAGFIGSHLCNKFIEQGHAVICLDNLFTGKKENIQHLENNKNFRFIEHDVMDAYNLDVDEIYNLACPASPPFYQMDPIKTMKTCVWGAINALELAKKTGAKIFQASTSEVYGDPMFDVQSELYWGNVNPIGIRSCYDEGKRAAETLFFDYKRQHNLNIRVVRIFNTYGPNMRPDDGRVVSNFIMQALKSNKITIYGDGTQTRSFCYINDLINGITKFMQEDIDCKTPINLGNPSPMNMLELAETIIKIVNKKVELDFKPLPQDDPKQRNPDISLAKSLLNWEPTINLQEGLKKTIEYFSKFI